MVNKNESREEIVNYLCGKGDSLSQGFSKLLKLSNMSEVDGFIIKNRLASKIDSTLDLDLEFRESFKNQYYVSHGLKDDLDINLIKGFQKDCFSEKLSSYYALDNFPQSQFDKYLKNGYYLKLLEKQYPQSVKEAVDMAIDELSVDSIDAIKDLEQSSFRIHAHFGLGMYMRNQFGLNGNRSTSLCADIRKKSQRKPFQSDDYSGFLCDEIWKEIQDNYEGVIESKSQKEELSVGELKKECRMSYESKEYHRVIEICDEILKSNPSDDLALSYEIMAYYYLNKCEKALEFANSALKFYQDYPRFLNLKSYVLFNMGCESEALDCLCGDNINIINKKLFLLLEMERTDEAFDFYKSLDGELLFNGFDIQELARNLATSGKGAKAIECYNNVLKRNIRPYNKFDYYFEDFKLLDCIKKDFIEYGLDLNDISCNDLYISWIDGISFEKPSRICPICGGKLTPVIYEDKKYYEFSNNVMIKSGMKEEKDEIVREKMWDENDPYASINEYHCRKCDKDFDMGICGIHIDCDGNYFAEKYGLYKVMEFNEYALGGSISKDELDFIFDYFDENELNSFIDKLKAIGYIVEVNPELYKCVL